MVDEEILEELLSAINEEEVENISYLLSLLGETASLPDGIRLLRNSVVEIDRRTIKEAKQSLTYDGFLSEEEENDRHRNFQ